MPLNQIKVGNLELQSVYRELQASGFRFGHVESEQPRFGFRRSRVDGLFDRLYLPIAGRSSQYAYVEAQISPLAGMGSWAGLSVRSPLRELLTFEGHLVDLRTKAKSLRWLERLSPTLEQHLSKLSAEHTDFIRDMSEVASICGTYVEKIDGLESIDGALEKLVPSVDPDEIDSLCRVPGVFRKYSVSLPEARNIHRISCMLLRRYFEETEGDSWASLLEPRSIDNLPLMSRLQVIADMLCRPERRPRPLAFECYGLEDLRPFF